LFPFRSIGVCLFRFLTLIQRPLRFSTLFPYTTLFRSGSWQASGSMSSRGRRSRSDHYSNRGPRSSGEASPAKRSVHASRTRRKRSEEHTSELQSRFYLVFRLLLVKKKNK